MEKAQKSTAETSKNIEFSPEFLYDFSFFQTFSKKNQYFKTVKGFDIWNL